MLFKLIRKEKEDIILFFFFFSIFLFFQLKTVYGGDAGDYVSTSSLWTFAHPPGYPFYSFLAGLLVHFLPWHTASWRIGFLSSIPGALALVLLNKILKKFFPKIISLSAVLLLAFLYPFWLYSEVVEVFSLNNLFIIALTFISVKFLGEEKSLGKRRLAKFILLILGLSFAHHHTIVLLFPSLWIIWKDYFKLKRNWPLFLLLIPGISFYLYLPISALRNPAINWGNPVNFQALINVILRTGYGTFWASPGINNTIMGRFLAVLAFFKYTFVDFQILGVLTVIAGLLIRIKLKDKLKIKFWNYSAIALLFYLFFLFYSSFQLNSDFGVATFERFLIAPYIFLTIFFAFGLDFALRLLSRALEAKKNFIIPLFYIVVLVVFPVAGFIRNSGKIGILRNDFTAENFAKDLLNTSEGGILIVGSDTTFFDTAAVYFGQNYLKNKTIFINQAAIGEEYYQDYLKKTHPDLIFEKALLGSGQSDFQVFLENNIKKYPVYSLPPKEVAGFKAIPNGLVFRYFPENSLPSFETVLFQNEALWQSYSNPLSGSLSKYRNLFLADVPTYYQLMTKSLGAYLIKEGRYQEAQKYLLTSLSYGEDPETSVFLGRTYLELRECAKAEETFNKLKNDLPQNPFPDAYLRQIYLNCYQNDTKAQDFLNSCLEKEKGQEIGL